MKCKQTASLLVLVMGIASFSIKSADAKNAFIQTPQNRISRPVTPSSSFTIAQLTDASSPIYGHWKLTFSVNGTVYKGYLIMKGYYGVLRVSYFDPNVRKKVTIDEGMRLMSSSQGLVLVGYNPVYAGTSISHPTYSADNFLFSIQPNGSLVAVTCDNQQRCSSVEVEYVK
ncbi:hypothetical protein [Trichormus variabilis]|uniref:RDD domain-containing protein n=1 Tax=Trichormus variabilis SAG 1403-4b TaxID=447716 RepID=A0A433UPE1_ANAVA|nr:hypothetical protein [Trichormus variabilis]MBD2626578.1 hypothetical protein [Trichormus variabilis FACHB-164]RUS95700.1 hypothetical protein DSM107003_28760 [Trichormus variabilis SAG 1403-4b]